MVSRLKIFKVKDWKAMAFCVLAASIFWFLSAMNHDFTVDIYYPLQIKYNDSSLVPVSPLPQKIKLNVKGYGWNLLRKYIGVQTEPIVYIPDDLPDRKYVSAFELSSVVTQQLDDVEFNYIVRDTLFFEFDYLTEKKVKVSLDSSSIALSPSYKIISPIILNPDSIIYKGPASFLSQIPDSVNLQVGLMDIKENVEEQIKVPEKGYSKVEMLNKEVKVRFGVAKFEKQSALVRIQPVNFPHDSTDINFDKNLILTYFVKEEDKNKIAQNDFLAYLDYQDLDRTDSTIGPTLIKKPVFIKDYYFTPYAVKITYKR